MKRSLAPLTITFLFLGIMLATVPTVNAHDAGECALSAHHKQVKAHALCEDRETADDHCMLSVRAQFVKVGIGCAE